MEKLKSDILEDVHKKNSDFISLIESNIKSDSKSPFNLNKNNQYDEKFKRIEDMINNEFNQYRSELNTNIINNNIINNYNNNIINNYNNNIINNCNSNIINNNNNNNINELLRLFIFLNLSLFLFSFSLSSLTISSI